MFNQKSVIKLMLLTVLLGFSAASSAKCLGDLNRDRRVDSVDFGIFRSTFNLQRGQVGYNKKADFNHDHKIDSVDFAIFRNVFNTTCPSDNHDHDDGEDCNE